MFSAAIISLGEWNRKQGNRERGVQRRHRLQGSGGAVGCRFRRRRWAGGGSWGRWSICGAVCPTAANTAATAGNTGLLGPGGRHRANVADRRGWSAGRRRSDIAAANEPMQDGVSGHRPFRPGCGEQRPPRYPASRDDPGEPEGCGQGRGKKHPQAGQGRRNLQRGLAGKHQVRCQTVGQRDHAGEYLVGSFRLIDVA